jgi:hypothetical protein
VNFKNSVDQFQFYQNEHNDEDEIDDVDKFFGFTDDHLLIATNSTIKYVKIKDSKFNTTRGEKDVGEPYEVRWIVEEINFKVGVKIL